MFTLELRTFKLNKLNKGSDNVSARRFSINSRSNTDIFNFNSKHWYR